MYPSLRLERTLWKQGHVVAGIDEVGRGAWAGPLVAAAVVFTREPTASLRGLKDSKQLLPSYREQFFLAIERTAAAIGVGVVEAEEIDRLGVGEANRLAMRRALEKLGVSPTYALVDAIRLDGVPLPTEAVPNGDERCRSIAAASIIAKVTRDRMMGELHHRDRRYRFDLHKGYGTELHHARLARYGPSAFHRRSFAPVASMLE